MEYRIRRATKTPELNGLWDGPAWSRANTMGIACAHKESSDHHPATQARFLFDDETLYGIYRVEDQYVRAVAQQFQDSVCRDSCVEAFLSPGGKEYLNFEFSCNGTLLCHHMVDSTRTGSGFKDARSVSAEDGANVRIFHSLSGVIDPELKDPTTWTLEFAIPMAVFERYLGAIGSPAGQSWKANFYKCADATSHPHWLSWAPVRELNFHRPSDFETIRFENPQP